LARSGKTLYCTTQSAYVGEARDRHEAKRSGGCMADLAKVLRNGLKKLKAGLSAKDFEYKGVHRIDWWPPFIAV